MKGKRQEKILQLIQRYAIQTQDELQKRLQSEGIVATQATISRDIKDLHLFKVAGVEKKYRYAYINKNETEI